MPRSTNQSFVHSNVVLTRAHIGSDHAPFRTELMHSTIFVVMWLNLLSHHMSESTFPAMFDLSKTLLAKILTMANNLVIRVGCFSLKLWQCKKKLLNI